MILLPIGRDDSEIRRHAWVSYAIMALCVIVFVLSALANLDAGPRAEAAVREAMHYLQDHPYLEVPDRLSPFLSAGDHRLIQALREVKPGGSAADVAAEQARLDELAALMAKRIDDISSRRWGYVPVKPSFLTLLSSMFMHGDLLHLLGNLLFFFITAPFVEDVFGRPIFSALYLSGGFVATWTYAARYPHSTVPLIGASGAIAAIMGAYLIRFWRSRLEFFFLPFWWRPTFYFRFFLPAFVMLPLWFLEQVFYASVGGNGSMGVAFAAHIGGFIYGLAFATVLKLGKIEERFIHPRIEGKISWTQNRHLLEAQEACARGDLGAASREIQTLLRDERDNVDGLQLGREIASQSGDRAAWRQYTARLFDHYVRLGYDEAATELIDEASAADVEHMPAQFLTRAASWMEKKGERTRALDLYRQAVATVDDGVASLRALVQYGRLLAEMNDRSAAAKLLEKARAHPACTGEWERFVEAEMERATAPPPTGGRIVPDTPV